MGTVRPNRVEEASLTPSLAALWVKNFSLYYMCPALVNGYYPLVRRNEGQVLKHEDSYFQKMVDSEI